MILAALDSVLNATRSRRIVWKKTGPDHYETTTAPKITIEFHYPQVGAATNSGADIAVVSLGGVSASFFSGTEGMAMVQSILRAAFPEWEEHLSLLEQQIENFTKQLKGSE